MYETNFPTMEVRDIYELTEISTRHTITFCTFRPCLICCGRKDEIKIPCGDGYRHQNHFDQAQILGLDFDGGTTIEDAVAQLEMMGLQYSVCTSANHRKVKHQGTPKEEPANDRFHILFPCAEPTYDIEVVRYNLKRLMTIFSAADKSCSNATRMFFAAPVVYKIKDKGLLYEWEIPKQKGHKEYIASLKNYAKNEIIPSHIKAWIANGTPYPGRHKLLYKIGAQLFHFDISVNQIIAMLAGSPLRDVGDKDLYRQVSCGWNDAKKQEELRNGEERTEQGGNQI